MARRQKQGENVDDGLDARTLPHNLEAERSILGAILVHNPAYEEAQQRVSANDFYRDAHRRIFAAMGKLFDRRVEVDFITLKETLATAGDLDEVGGPAYIASLADGVPRATNVRYYSEIVREKSLLRALIFAANQTLTDAYAAEEPVDVLVAQADKRMLDVASGLRTGRLVDVKDGIKDLIEAIDARSAARGTLVGVTTGFNSLDELTLGWQAGDLTVVAARPSIGKTTFVLNSAQAVAGAGHFTAIFSLEMKRRQLEMRMLASLSRVDLTRIMSGYLGSVDHTRMAQAFETIYALPMAIDDRTGQRVEQIRAACRRQKAERGLGLVVIDYVQLMPGSLDNKATRNEQVTDISRRLKELAGELNVPVLLLSQLSRANEKRADPRPRLSDLRESGALEQDADNVLFLHRENHRASGTTECILEKQRNGPTGTVLLNLERDIVTFTDAGPKPVDLPPPPPPPELPGMEGSHGKRRRRPHF